MFKFESPAIKLPDQTPVRGKGTDTNAARVKYFEKLLL